jgi:hypothetical protein
MFCLVLSLGIYFVPHACGFSIVSISQSYPGKKCDAIHRPTQFAQKP